MYLQEQFLIDFASNFTLLAFMSLKCFLESLCILVSFLEKKKKASERCNFHCQTLRFMKLSEIMVLIILTQNYAAEE